MKYTVALFVYCLSVNPLAITGTSIGKIVGIRLEGTAGLITLPSNVIAGTTECQRVWVDLTQDSDRTAFSVAMMAFADDMTVTIRAVSNGKIRHGACDFYDIYIHQA